MGGMIYFDKKRKREDSDDGSALGYKLGLDMVDIFVSPTKKHYRVHRDLICDQVPYFEKMFNSGFKESFEQAATLPEEDPNTFALFLEWIYGNDRLAPMNGGCTHELPPVNGPPCPYLARIRLYAYAEKICLPYLQDYIMTNLMSNYASENLLPPHEHVELTYEITTPESHLRFYMANTIAYTILNYDDEDDWETGPIVEVMH